MHPTLCSRCKKNVAVIFVTKIEAGKTKSDGFCLNCAKDLGLKPVDEIMKRMGLTEEDLEGLNNEMIHAFEGVENLMAAQSQEDREPDEDDEDMSQTATFPFLSSVTLMCRTFWAESLSRLILTRLWVTLRSR